MAANIFLAGTDAEDFDETVRSAVKIEDTPDQPDALADMDRMRCYGAPETKRDSYEKMTEGDLILFHRDGEYIGTALVGTSLEDTQQWVSSTIWTETSTSLVYTVEDFSAVTVPARAVNRIFEYADGYAPPNFMRVADKRVTNRPTAIAEALKQYSEHHTS